MVSRMKISSCVQDGLNLSATYNVAMMYHHGLHVKRNTHKALEFFQESHGVREVAYRVLSPFDSTEYGDEYLALTPGDAVYVKEVKEKCRAVGDIWVFPTAPRARRVCVRTSPGKGRTAIDVSEQRELVSALQGDPQWLRVMCTDEARTVRKGT